MRSLTGIHSFVWSTLILLAAAVGCYAQTVISAHSGTVNYFEGAVSVDSAPIQPHAGRFYEVKGQSVLRTAQGRAEVLLTPGVFLRVGEDSAIKMLDNRLSSTRVEILSGTVIAESDDPKVSISASPVGLIYKAFSVQMLKHALIEIDSDSAQIKVYRGEAVVDITGSGIANNRATLRKGELLPFSTAFLSERFDDRGGDALYFWALKRAQSVLAANLSLERSADRDDWGCVGGPTFAADRKQRKCQ